MSFFDKFIIIIASIIVSALVVRAAFSIIVGSKPTLQSAIRASALKKLVFFVAGSGIGFGIALAKEYDISSMLIVPFIAAIMMGIVFVLYVKTLVFDSRPNNKRIALVALIEGVFLASTTIFMMGADYPLVRDNRITATNSKTEEAIETIELKLTPVATVGSSSALLLDSVPAVSRSLSNSK